MYLHGITERLRQAPLRLAVPSLFNVTAHSLSKKIDDLRLPVLNYRWTSCITIISKPRLHESKGASEPTAHLKKKKGGGLWVVVIEKQDLEYRLGVSGAERQAIPS